MSANPYRFRRLSNRTAFTDIFFTDARPGYPEICVTCWHNNDLEDRWDVRVLTRFESRTDQKVTDDHWDILVAMAALRMSA